MRRAKSYFFRCRYPFAKQEAFSGPGNGKMEPAPSSTPGSSYFPGQLSETALQQLWYDVRARQDEFLTVESKTLLMICYSNLPPFLQQFVYCYYENRIAISKIAAALNISTSLAQQRKVVTTALFRILLAAKPKNPV